MNDDHCSKQESASPSALSARYSFWGEHPDHSVSNWQYAVANGDTRSGTGIEQDRQKALAPDKDSHDLMTAAVQTALAAFWREVATSFPQVTTGDLSPDAALALEECARRAVQV